MTAIFVHGVPETERLWDDLLEHLVRDDVVALGLPGFGSALPDGFEPTMYGYSEWLAAELSAYDDVDLVGHDWGALLTLRVLADRPANVRSWVVDAGDLGDDFRWHDLALLWQRPGEGEAFMDGMVSASSADRAELLAGTGVPESGALVMAEAFDATMAAAILSLYRSATDVGSEWGGGIDSIAAPGLVLESLRDPFRAADRARRLAARTGAAIVTLPDEGHWWMLESPTKVAAVLADFWERVAAG
jgi:pimeloyl-ACP methyl ester carboxylesterase